MDERTIMKFKDEDGNVVELEAMAELYVDEVKYLVLAEVGDESGDEYVYRVDVTADGQEELNAVEDDAEFKRVRKEYKSVLYEEGGSNE